MTGWFAKARLHGGGPFVFGDAGVSQADGSLGVMGAMGGMRPGVGCPLWGAKADASERRPYRGPIAFDSAARQAAGIGEFLGAELHERATHFEPEAVKGDSQACLPRSEALRSGGSARGARPICQRQFAVTKLWA